MSSGIYSDVRRLQSLGQGLATMMVVSNIEQIRRVGDLATNRPGLWSVELNPFDLPEGYVMLRWSDGFTCGVSADGEVSS